MNAFSDLIALNPVTVSGALFKNPLDLRIVAHKGFEARLRNRVHVRKEAVEIPSRYQTTP